MNLSSFGHRKGHIREGHLTGFTLIELLVVIAIIGILSSVVLASLNTARAKGADAAIKSNIDSARAQAELYYDSGQTYAGVCAALPTATPPGLAGIQSGINAAGGTASCADAAGAYRISSPLKAVANTWFCTDNTGTSTTKTAAPSGTAC
jgi:prepilin-type N-terminal cleavage/methylation domain-containing protein